MPIDVSVSSSNQRSPSNSLPSRIDSTTSRPSARFTLPPPTPSEVAPLECARLLLQVLMTGERVRSVLALVLAIGNYMNGGTTRGQADGFGLEILPKLKDVKSKDNAHNLLQFVVHQYVRKHDLVTVTSPTSSTSGTLHIDEKALCPVPEPADVEKASHVNFDDVDKEIRRLKENVEGKKGSKTVHLIRFRCLRVRGSWEVKAVIQISSQLQLYYKFLIFFSLQQARQPCYRQFKRRHNGTFSNRHASFYRQWSVS